MKRFTLCLLALAAGGLLAANGAGAAEPKSGDRMGDWQYRCQAVSKSETVCGLVQTIADRGTKKQVLAVTVRPIGNEKQSLAMVVTVPLGIFLGTGIDAKIDDGDQFSFRLQSCTKGGCQAAIELKDKLLGELKAGKRMIVGFKPSPGAKPVVVPVSLNGFTDGVAALAN